MKNVLKYYLEYCFAEMPTGKDEYFLSFKVKKRTLENIINIFMFIFEENEYPIEIIAQAEINLKKNYRLITFLPCLQDELGGSNFLNKITIKYSNILKTRLIDMYKNIELEENELMKITQTDKEINNKSHF